MLPDFNRLNIFYRIYVHKSIAGASKELHVTQSAVSQHLQKLETEINTALFTRQHRRLVPTHTADRLFNIICPFVKNLEEGLNAIREEKEMPSGLLRIGAPVEFGERYLINILSLFRQQFPAVGFQLELGHPFTLLPMIRDGRLDFALADIFSRKGEYSRDLGIFHIDTVLTEELILVGSADYLTSNIQQYFSFEELSRQFYLSYQEHAPALKSWFRHHFSKTSVNLNTVLTVESVRAVITGVKHGMGLGIIPSHLVKEEIESGEIIAVTTQKEALKSEISLVQLQNKSLGITEKTFINHFKKEIKKIGLI